MKEGKDTHQKNQKIILEIIYSETRGNNASLVGLGNNNG